MSAYEGDKMYKKKAKFNFSACDAKLAAICNELLTFNADAVFAISKNYVENKGKNNSFEEIKTNPIIISSIPLEELVLPSYYALRGDAITLWYDDSIIVKLVYSNLVFSDGDIKNKHIDNLYLDIENEDYIKSLKGM